MPGNLRGRYKVWGYPVIIPFLFVLLVFITVGTLDRNKQLPLKPYWLSKALLQPSTVRNINRSKIDISVVM